MTNMITDEEAAKLLDGVNRPEPGQLDYCAIADAAPDLARTVIALHADRDRLAAANAALEAQVARLVGAAVALRHAVCGETGFAACVRADSGRAYPWPALDEAEVLVNAALAEVQADARREGGE